MIEKYKSSWEYDCSSTPEAWTHNCYMLVNFVEGLKLKINELVDAVNEIMTWRFDCDDETPAENMQPDYVTTSYMTDGHTQEYYGQNGARVQFDYPIPAGYTITIKEIKGGDNGL